jgi:predicted outer membrane repeat protein
VCNVAGGNGGAINSSTALLICDRCSFLHNMAVTKGGAIFAVKDVVLTNVVFIRNIKNGSGTCSASNMNSGGAILQTSGKLSLTNCIFNKNRNINDNCNSMILFLFYFYFFSL